MKTQWGFSLVEVLVALAVLAIGVVSVAQLQAASLRFSSRGEVLQNANMIARAELEHRLQFALSPNPVETCLANLPSSYVCTVSVLRCRVEAGVLDCGESVAVEDTIGYEISVTASGRREDTATLVSFVGSLVSASGASDEDASEDEGVGEPSEGDGNDDGGGEGGSGDGGTGGGDDEGDDGEGEGDDGTGTGPGRGRGPGSVVPPQRGGG